MSMGMNDQWENRVKEAATTFDYPPTPDVAGAVAKRSSERVERAGTFPKRGLVWAAVVGLFIIVLTTLASSQVRAAIADFLQIGAVRIWLVEPTTTPEPIAETAQPTPTLAQAVDPRASVLDLSGETTLEEAQAQLDYPLRLPTYPPDLGAPQHVFIQQTNNRFAILVWTYPNDPERVQLVMYQIGPNTGVEKGGLLVLHDTSVHGRPAVWVAGTHYLSTVSQGWSEVRTIDQDVLLWTEDVDGNEITYRLETGLLEEETIRIAESLE